MPSLIQTYSTAAETAIYLKFHFGPHDNTFVASFDLARFTNFNERVLDRFLTTNSVLKTGSALDLGCAVGGASFHLSRLFRRVLGIDASGAFIAAAEQLRMTGTVAFAPAESETHSAPLSVSLPPGVQRERVRFLVGDATNLDSIEEPFDCIVALNLLCRLKEPRRFLSSLPRLLRPGGLLLLSTPWNWDETFSQKSEWLPEPPAATLLSCLAPFFVLKDSEEVPFIMEEKHRHLHLCISYCSSWIRAAI